MSSKKDEITAQYSFSISLFYNDNINVICVVNEVTTLSILHDHLQQLPASIDTLRTLQIMVKYSMQTLILWKPTYQCRISQGCSFQHMLYGGQHSQNARGGSNFKSTTKRAGNGYYGQIIDSLRKINFRPLISTPFVDCFRFLGGQIEYCVLQKEMKMVISEGCCNFHYFCHIIELI